MGGKIRRRGAEWEENAGLVGVESVDCIGQNGLDGSPRARCEAIRGWELGSSIAMDYAFERLFGSAGSTSVLIDLLNAVVVCILTQDLNEDDDFHHVFRMVDITPARKYRTNS